MPKKFMSKAILLLLILSVSITAAACVTKDKQTVISDNVSGEAKQEENELQRDISLGDNYLNQGKYDDAKQAYEKAISLDKGNKQTYLSIKDKYLGIGRTDDAYYFTELAVQNNVDTENMNNILAEISGKYETTKISTALYVNAKYALPDTALVKINNVETDVPVSWSGVTKIDTSKPCSYTIKGDCIQYGRKVENLITVNYKVASIDEACQILNDKLKPGKDIDFYYIKDSKDSKIGDNYYCFQKRVLKGPTGDLGSIFFVEKSTGDIYVYDLNKVQGPIYTNSPLKKIS